MNRCHICGSIVCIEPLVGDNIYDECFDCDCERYWCHYCKCGPICQTHHIGDYDDSGVCDFCLPPKQYYEFSAFRLTLQTWMKIATSKLGLPYALAKKVGLYLLVK